MQLDSADFYRPPDWAVGHVSAEDAAFLDSMVKCVAPPAVIEVGVASGCSSAALLRSLAGLSGGGHLYSFDVAETCYFDHSRPVGGAVSEMAPDLAGNWSLHTGCLAIDASRQLKGQQIRLAFVDADHRHPWPTLDVHALLPALAADAWVILHDVALASFTNWKVFGPEILFSLWPGEKRSGSGRGNIGAIRLPGDPAKARDWLNIALRRPWETKVEESTLDLLGIPKELRDVSAPTAALSADLVERLQSLSNDGRPFIVWGAGSAGHKALVLLLSNGLRPSAFLDSDAAKIGRSVQGIPVRSVDALDKSSQRPFALIASMYAHEIEKELEQRGYVRETDFASLEPTGRYSELG